MRYWSHVGRYHSGRMSHPKFMWFVLTNEVHKLGQENEGRSIKQNRINEHQVKGRTILIKEDPNHRQQGSFYFQID